VHCTTLRAQVCSTTEDGFGGVDENEKEGVDNVDVGDVKKGNSFVGNVVILVLMAP